MPAVHRHRHRDLETALVRLRRAGGGVLRTLAPRQGTNHPDSHMPVPVPPGNPQPEALAPWRGRIDALAMRARYSDARLYARHVPASAAAKNLYSLLEQNRVEALGASGFPGVGANLAALAGERWIRARPEAAIHAQGIEWLETFALLARIPLGAPMPAAARAAGGRGWQSWMSGEQIRELDRLVPLLSRQEDYASQSVRVIATVLRDAAAVRDEPRQQGAENDEPPAPGRHYGASPASAGVAPDVGATRGGAAADTAGTRPALTYRVYTSAHDLTEQAAELLDAPTAARLRAALDAHLGSSAAKIARWAHRLQRKLLALQARAWQFDCEEGELDASRLTRVATQPLAPLAYRRDVAPDFPETVVTLLVDNSGSMRGAAIALAAVCAEVLARVLERCAVKTEILGFTTRSWRGGRAAEAWAIAGRPPGPGRIAELRHLIYKRAEQPWRRARPIMGAMLDDDLLKENIDGEALLWAYNRLKLRPEPRKFMLLISDGAPHDEATLDANGAAYLDRHLRDAVGRIERDRSVKLAAIGIGHEVNSRFRHAVTLQGVEELGEAVVVQLLALFDPKSGVQ